MPIKPKLGQNFLNDTEAIQRIAGSLGDLTGRTVVEIGPGRGAITGALAARAGHLLAVELDRELVPLLRAEFPAERVTVFEQSVLHFDFAAARAGIARRNPEEDPSGAKALDESGEIAARLKSCPDTMPAERLLVVGNLPYNITSQILLKLAANHAVLDRAVLMVQREVADRITAAPGSRDYGLLSVTVQMYGPVVNLFTLPPSSFTPPPDVHSTVFRWRFAPRFEELGVAEAGFTRFLRRAFAQKRKTLGNNLRAGGFEAAVVERALGDAEVGVKARAEELAIEELAGLWRGLETDKKPVDKDL
jgi:16S rRNA (adenine1518-N6/adenine1519-N6)-dimethyltransferase